MLPNIDHLVYTVADLGAGMNTIERLFGVRPVPGGRHPAFGTHNALVSLGMETYLEIIAPDPGLPRPDRGMLFGMDGLRGSRLATWVLRTEAIDVLAAAADSAGLGLGQMQSGGRESPDGTMLSWQVTDPYAMPLGGAVRKSAADAGYWSSHKDPATQSDSPETERSWPPPTVE
jgi:hypothetical protein